MLYWHNPFPIYPATFVFRVFPRKKQAPSVDPTGYYTTFFWGNDGTFIWDGGNANTYYGAHPYPIPENNGPGQWEISVGAVDYVTGSEVVWNRWYTQVFRAWRESSTVTQHEFYWDYDAWLASGGRTGRLSATITDPNWAKRNPPRPAIVVGQAPNMNGASWGGYPGWEEFKGIIRGMQFYSSLLSMNDVAKELAAPGSAVVPWYLNLNPTPTDVADRSGNAHHPAWDGSTAKLWVG